jgi:hypothetical protein
MWMGYECVSFYMKNIVSNDMQAHTFDSRLYFLVEVGATLHTSCGTVTAVIF